MGKTVTDDQVSILELVTKRIEGHSNGVLKTTMEVLSRKLTKEAQRFFQDIFVEFNTNLLNKIEPHHASIKWSSTSRALGYTQNEELTTGWRRLKWARNNPQDKRKVVGLTEVGHHLFEASGDLKRDLSAAQLGGKAKGRLGAIMFRNLGGIENKYIKFNIPVPSAFEKDAKGKIRRVSSGAQVPYKTIVTKEMKNRINFSPIQIIPGTGTFKTSKKGRLSKKGQGGTISVFQAAQEGRIMAGMTFSIMKHLNFKLLNAKTSYSPVVKAMVRGGLIDDKTGEKLHAAKKYGHHLIDPYFIKRVMGSASENPNGGSLESRLSNIQEKFFKGGKKRR